MGRKWAWTALAIVSMWLAVLFTSLFAPSLETVSAAGDTTKLPLAGIVVAAVAFIATIVVAVQGFRGPEARELDVERRQEERERLEARIAELERRLASQRNARGELAQRIAG